MGKRFLKKRRYVVIVLAVLFTFFTACGNGKKTADTEEKTEHRAEKQTEDVVYQVSFRELRQNFSQISGMCEQNGRIYMTASYEEGDAVKNYLVDFTKNGKVNIKKLKLKKREHISIISAGEADRLPVLTCISNGKDGNAEYFLKELGTDGSVSKGFKLEIREEDDYFLNGGGAVLAKDGSLYAVKDGTVTSFDKEGKKDGTYPLGDRMEDWTLAETEAGELYAYCAGQDQKNMLKKLDRERKTAGETIVLKGRNLFNAALFSGNGNEIYLWDTSGIYLADLSKKEIKPLLNWVSNGISGQDIKRLAVMEDGTIAASLLSYGEKETTAEAVFLEKADASEGKERKVLRLLCAESSTDLEDMVLRFNKANSDYRIELKDYSVYEDAGTRLNLELASGAVPDLLYLNGLPVDLYEAKGLFTDLYPLMEKDGEVKKEAFLDSVIKASEQDGKLYYLPYSFYIRAFAGGKKFVGDREGWSFEEMMEAYKNRSEDRVFSAGFRYREDFWQNFFASMTADFVSWDTGEVRFDSEKFLTMLEFTKTLPQIADAKGSDRIDEEAAAESGSLQMVDLMLTSVSTLPVYTELFKHEDGYTIVSYPSEDKNNGLFMGSMLQPAAITEQCEDKEGAWEFLRSFYTYEGQKNFSVSGLAFMVRKDVFEEQIDALTEEEADKLRLAVDRIDKVYPGNNDVSAKIVDIISEEAAAFYAGDKTAEETAEIIQNRVKLYVSENL